MSAPRQQTETVSEVVATETAEATVRTNARPVTGSNPLEGEQLLLDAMYGDGAPPKRKPPAPKRARRADHQRPLHYKVVSISLYNEDIERLENMVSELKTRGHHKANKSQLIREALARLDIDALERPR